MTRTETAMWAAVVVVVLGVLVAYEVWLACVGIPEF